MGAAITAGVGVGVFDNFEVTDRFIKIQKELCPNCENTAVYDEMKRLFENVYQQLCPIFAQM